MKKLIAALTALVLIFSLTTVAYGAKSPEGKKEHSVTVNNNVGDTDGSSSSVVDGENFTLSADEFGGYDFVGWVITGDYDIVSGDLNSPDLIILPKGDIQATANYTEKVELKDDEVKVEYASNIDGLEEGNFDIVKKGDKVELSATEELPGYAFLKWEIVGPYEIVSGDLDSPELVIRPLGNVIVKQVFEIVEDEAEPEDDEEEEPEEDDDEEEEPKPEDKPEKDEEEDKEDEEDGKKPPKGETNDSDKSPPTGMALPIVGLFAALGAAVVSKKLSE